MFIFNKAKDFFDFLLSLKFYKVQFLVNKCKDFIKETKIKLNDLSKANFDLGIYHLNKGNLNDAILRFKLVKRFGHQYDDIDYFLGRCYLEKLKYSKAKILFENYIIKNNPKFLEEAKYCLNITDNELHDIKSVPVGIVDHKLNQKFDSYVKVAKAFQNKKSSQNITYEKIKEALENNDKVFNYNMLDLGCNLGVIVCLLRENQLLHFSLGVEINKNMMKYCKELTIDSNKVYNTVINQDIDTFLASKIQTDSKFDIILGTHLITYSTDLKSLFIKLKKYIRVNGIMAFSFSVKPQDASYIFDRQLEIFIYNKDYVAKTVKSCGWQVINHEEMQSKKAPYPQITMVLKLN